MSFPPSVVHWSKHLLNFHVEGISPLLAFSRERPFSRQRCRLARRVRREATHAHARRPRECDRPFAPNLETPRPCPAPRPGGRVDMAPASRDAPDVPNEDARDDCRTKQSSPEGGEGSVEEDTRVCDAETTPDDATDTKPDEDDNSRQVRGSARASRHDPFPERAVVAFFSLLSMPLFRRGAFRRGRPRSVSAPRVVECAAPPVHGRARADPERPPPAFPAFRVDVRPHDAGSSKTPELPEAFSRRFC